MDDRRRTMEKAKSSAEVLASRVLSGARIKTVKNKGISGFFSPFTFDFSQPLRRHYERAVYRGR